ncbi:MAG: Ribosomal small subunit pseudouridine synthase [Oscillospiraceae bacterium]|nr:Ribosomal small subunit pseudouridine synthase [Oscillospiraceae bacterium]
MERADKILANTGRWSRKEVKELIRQGRVTADGSLLRRSEDKLAETVVLAVDGERVTHSAKTYLMMNKPAGILSSTEDRQKTVIDLLPEHLREIGLFPVGRLDKDTEGLLLLTDDGQLAHRMLSPKKHVDKRYFVRVNGELNEADAQAFENGLILGDGLHCMPAGLALTERSNEGFVTLREGKYHQVKRMLAARGKPVIYLKRLSMGNLELDERLNTGEWRALTGEELTILSSLGIFNKKEVIPY